MKPFRAIRYKALFLLVSFSLNTVVGFACSLGVDMGFNSKHHSPASGEQQEHADADHHHDEHDGNNSHSGQHEPISHHQSHNPINTLSFTSQCGDNCCKDFVAGFHNLDKLLVKQDIIQKKIQVLTSLITTFTVVVKNTKGFILHPRTPPREIDYSPPDIRVFIRSFLI